MDEKLSGPREKRLQAVTKHESRYLFGSLRKISFYNSICRQANPLNCLGNKASGVETRNKRFENCFRGLTKTIFSQAPKFSAFLNCTLQSHGSLFYVTEFSESLQVSGCFWKLCQTLFRAESCPLLWRCCDLVIGSDIAKELVVCLFVRQPRYLRKAVFVHWTAFSWSIHESPIVLSIHRVVDEALECKFIFQAACFQENRWKS